MHFPPSRARAISSLAAIALCLLSGCSQQEVDLDPSLSVTEYERVGVPAPTGRWTTAEYVQATKALEALGSRAPRSLPRAGSRRSGKIFGELVSGEPFKVLTDDSLTIHARWEQRAELAEAVHRIIGVYGQAGGQTADFAREEIELVGVSLSLLALSLDIVSEFETKLGAGSEQQAAWRQEIEGVRVEIAEHLHTVLVLLDGVDQPDPGDQAPDLEPARRLARRFVDATPRIMEGLTPEQQAPLRAEIVALRESTPDQEIRQLLTRLLQVLAGDTR